MPHCSICDVAYSPIIAKIDGRLCLKKRVSLITLMVILFSFSGCATILEKYNSPVDTSDKTEVIFEVPSGASTGKIADLLEAQGLIQNARSFKTKAKEMAVDGQMKAGSYKLSKSMDVPTIINLLVAGEIFVETTKVTIPEGYEVRQIVEKLESADLIDAEVFKGLLKEEPFDYKFLESVNRDYLLEGFLFPDTYEIPVGASEKEIIVMMLNRFNAVFETSYYDRAEELGLSVHDVVTLASIIEREARVAEEFELVSSVFHNRIEIGMPLQSCATVQYILGERKDRLTYDDIAIKSPFNTYLEKGLTPEPIASPGARAIYAALYPAETSYLYFVTTEKNDGSHYFNETLAGHERDAKKGK